MLRISALAWVLAAMLISPTLVWAEDRARVAQTPDQATSAETVNGIRTERHGTSVLKIDTTGKGAVLCMLGLLEGIEKIGSECRAGEDPEFQHEVRRSIERIDQFVVENSVPRLTSEQVTAQRAARDRMVVPHVSLCGKDSVLIYQALRASGADKLRASVTDLLSIPREPVINPCL
ncbi:hypothetical protein ABS772_24305 [Methylorubrum podarium]|uniref:Secreted protein n=1 Tax=Methylorubrum podarium TaxID=200476 RepID=A0ABV1QUM2_9HYPH